MITVTPNGFDSPPFLAEGFALSDIFQRELGSDVLRILLVEDDEVDALLARTLLQKSRLGRFELVWESEIGAAFERLAQETFHVCLLDYKLRGFDGLSFLKTARIRRIDLPFILLTGAGSLELDLAVMQHGASDYLEKDGLSAALMERSIRYSLREHALRRELRRLAQYDELTGIKNRRAFQQTLEEALLRARRRKTMVALLFLDLDGFKQVNDTYGHKSGDMILHEMARRMESCVRAVDTVGRLGGDEFAILLEDLKVPDDARRVASAVLQEVRRSWTLPQAAVQIGVSIGISLYPLDHREAEQLVILADQAMYTAKIAGKNTFRFSATSSQACPQA